MATNIKITALTDIGSGPAANTLIPVVNMVGTPETMKATLANVANTILNAAGGTYAPAAIATVAYAVANAAQPAITSVGTLSSLSVAGNITTASGYFVGDGGHLSNITVSTATTANYANYAGNAFNVSGSNVSGAVANATYSNYAGEAYMVAGGNVSGPVASAAVATTAIGIDSANITNIPTTHTYIVAKGGNDATADGSTFKPFQTIQAAVDYAASVAANVDYSTVLINPGVYAESVNVSSPRIALVGTAHGQTKQCAIEGNIIIHANAIDGVADETYSLENLYIFATSGGSDLVTINGSSRGTFIMDSCYLYSDQASGKGLFANNGNVDGIIMHVNDSVVELSNPTNADIAVDISNVLYSQIESTDINSGLGAALSVTNSVVELFNGLLISQNSAEVVSVNSAHIGAPIPNVALNIAQSYFETGSTSNPSGISLSANVGVVVNNSTFKIPDVGGNLVRGVGSSSELIYGFLGAYPGTTANISAAMTAQSLITTVTPV